MTKTLNEKALAYSFRLLKIRLRSARELRDKLILRGYNASDVEAILAYLIDSGEVNDQFFAKCWVEDRMNLNPKALLALSIELKERGISKDIIDNTLLKLLKEYDFSKLAFELAKERLATFEKSIDSQIAKRRIFDYLSRKGFETSIIDEVLGELF